MATRRTRKSSTSKKQSTNLAARTARTVKNQPYTSAAIATGAAALVGAVAGLVMLKKSGKSVGQLTDEVTTKVKKGVSEATSTVKDGLADARTKIEDAIERRRDGIDPDKNQEEIMEEALTLKETGKKAKRPSNKTKTMAEQSKVGSVAY